MGEALRIASTFGWDRELYSINYALAQLFLSQEKFDDSNAHIERAKSYVSGDEFTLGCAMKWQAAIWYFQNRFEEANLEALSALEIFEKLGASEDVKRCKDILRDIDSELLEKARRFPRLFNDNFLFLDDLKGSSG